MNINFRGEGLPLSSYIALRPEKAAKTKVPKIHKAIAGSTPKKIITGTKRAIPTINIITAHTPAKIVNNSLIGSVKSHSNNLKGKRRNFHTLNHHPSMWHFIIPSERTSLLI